MDSLREPVGDQPPEVYWRRRIVAATGLVLLLVVLYFLVTSRGGNDNKSPAVTPPPDSTAGATVSADPSAPPTGDVSRACGAPDVQLTLDPTAANFGAGKLPAFTVGIKNASASPCLLDTAATGSEFIVWSGGESNKDMYFSTAYCPGDGTITPRQLLLAAGAEESMSVTWSRERKGEGCTAGAAPAAGYYWAQLTLQGISSEPTQFQLSN